MPRLSLLIGCLFSLCWSAQSFAEEITSPPYAVSVIPDRTFGQGQLLKDGRKLSRDLLLDVYRPATQDQQMLNQRPAVVLAFGGAFHRGGRGFNTFHEEGAQDSSMADYCQSLARAGYVCFAMEYRLMPEHPVLETPVDPSRQMPMTLAVNANTTARIDAVRQAMGLEKLDESTRPIFWDTIFAAAEDLAKAVDYVQRNADEYGVDASKVAVGGFSSGAITAINLAYGTNAPVKAVLSLSGSTWGYYLPATVHPQQPPLLAFVGQNDLPGVLHGSASTLSSLESAGIPFEAAWVPGFGHFYPKGAVSLGADLSRLSVEQRILRFLEQHLQ